LAKFGAVSQKLRPRIETLLRRCLLDTDDEVRDRATFYLALLQNGQPTILSNYILNALQVVFLNQIYLICVFRSPKSGWSEFWINT
jgi:hypothetical protein